jgi:ribonuclease D
MPTFPVDTVDVGTADAAGRALAELASAAVLAVDVEADAMHAFHARLCFLQVSDDAHVFLFDTLVPEVRADALAPLFADPSRTKFFHAAGGDLQYLAEAGVRVKGLFDTHRAATLLGWLKVGLADLARDLLGVDLPKGHQQSDFSIRPLPPDMREYIANDVRYLCEIGRRVRDACRQADILEEVELDCQRLSDEAANRPDQTALAPRVPRQGSAEQHALAVAMAQALHERRLQWAEAANVPMGRMLSNAAIVAIATRPPSGLKALAKAQGVRGGFVREHGEAVLALGQELAERQRAGKLEPVEVKGARDPARKKREEALKAFRAAKAAERKVTPSVVLPNSLAEDMAARPPRSLEELAQLPYIGEKRLRLYGPELLEVLARAG